MSEKSKGKQRAANQDTFDAPLVTSPLEEDEPRSKVVRGRHVTIIFSGEGDGAAEGNLEIWVEDDESVGTVKDQVRLLFPPPPTRLFASARCVCILESVGRR